MCVTAHNFGENKVIIESRIQPGYIRLISSNCDRLCPEDAVSALSHKCVWSCMWNSGYALILNVITRTSQSEDVLVLGIFSQCSRYKKTML